MRRLRTFPSPPTVIASVALLLALGGTSIAAVNALPRNSVGTAQLKANAVTSAKVKNGTLLKADFRSGSLPAGPAGPQGPAGMSAREDIAAETPTDSVSPKTMRATCSAGKKVVGGGIEIGGTGRSRVTVTENLPAADNSWEAEAFEIAATGLTWKLEVHAICATIAP